MMIASKLDGASSKQFIDDTTCIFDSGKAMDRFKYSFDFNDWLPNDLPLLRGVATIGAAGARGPLRQ